MGEVYRAHDERLDRDVALKLLPAGALADEAARKRLRKEALALSRLRHPHIASVFDFDTQDGIDFLVMELIPGLGLEEKLASGPLPETELLRLGAQLARGLAAAHEHGVVHRDLKPSNLRLTEDGLLKILDFGLARVVAPLTERSGPTQTAEPAFAGTLPYMAPEQIRGQPVDARTDVYTVGNVLFEMATGKRPFAEAHGPLVTEAILHQVPSSPRQLEPELSPGLEFVILKSLEKDPERRYQSAKELLLDLERLAAPSAVTAAPARPRRRRWPVVVAAASALVLALGGVAAWRLLRTARETPITSLAVLPLKNLSGDPAQEYFAEGMHEALTTAVSKIGALRVISSTSVMRYKGTDKPLPQIARELNVDAVVEGSVLAAGDRVRINAQLIQAATDAHLWAESYDRPLRDVLAVHDEVARAIAGRVKVALTPEEERRLGGARGVDPEAYREYLKGNFHILKTSPDSPQTAIQHYEAAIERDPAYAPAYAGLSFAYANLGSWFGWMSSREAFPKARAAALRALELDNQLPEAHIALASVKYLFEWDWPGAEFSFRSGMALNPRSTYARVSYANYLTAMGRFDESIALGRETLDLDPVSPVAYNELAWALDFAGRENEALEYYRKASDLEPDFLQTLLARGDILARKGRTQEAIAHLQKAEAVIGAGTATLGLVAYYYALAGRRADALRLLERLQQAARGGFVWPSDFVFVYCGLGEKQRALDWLEKAYADRDPSMVFLRVQPQFRGLRDEPRYQELLRRMRLDR